MPERALPLSLADRLPNDRLQAPPRCYMFSLNAGEKHSKDYIQESSYGMLQAPSSGQVFWWTQARIDSGCRRQRLIKWTCLSGVGQRYAMRPESGGEAALRERLVRVQSQCILLVCPPHLLACTADVSTLQEDLPWSSSQSTSAASIAPFPALAMRSSREDANR